MRAAGFVLSWLLLVGCGGGGGDQPGEPEDGPDERIAYHVGPQAGRWHAPRTHRNDPGLTDEQREDIAALEGIGYSDGLHAAPRRANVTRHDPERAFAGVNLYTPAHAPTARLIDMDGNVLHEWLLKRDWPRGRDNKHATFWRRTHLFENGDLLAIYEGLGLVKIDKDSKLLWASPLRTHHDLEVLADGTIYVLGREAHLIPAISREKAVLEDFVAILSPDGAQQRRISLIDAMRGSEFEEDWSERVHLFNGDLFHTNTLAVLDGTLAEKNPAFRQGNILLSMLLLDLVCILDPDEGRIVWGKVGPYKLQHDPQELDSGVVLIFDNQGAGPETSRLLELDPATWEEVWSFEGTDEEPFYSETCGLAQRLPNGNTLITESDFGRAFEITREGDVVWEFVNPHRAGKDGRFIATLMEMVRLPGDFPLDWANGGE